MYAISHVYKKHILTVIFSSTLIYFRIDNSVADCDEYQTWQHTEKEIKKRLPFRNVQWRSTTGRQRVIDQLDVKLVPYKNNDGKSTPVEELHGQPLMNLYFVSCDVCTCHGRLYRMDLDTFL
jgi:hypothetical protein